VTDDRSYTARVAGRTPLEIGGAFVQHVRGTAMADDEAALLAEAFEAERLAGV
jgi:hypothetical protein